MTEVGRRKTEARGLSFSRRRGRAESAVQDFSQRRKVAMFRNGRAG